MHESYSVYCSDDCGRRSGKDFETRVEADNYFNQTIKSGSVVYVVLYGWTAIGKRDELRRWAA